MSMTSAYLKHTQTPVTPNEGVKYRVLGFNVSGAIYEVEKIENNLCKFKGYVRPIEISKLLFYNF